MYMERNASAVRRSRGLDPQFATTPVPPSIKLGGNGFTTKIAVDGEWEVASIANPMIMSFDGMAHFLHFNLMKENRGFDF